MTSDAPMPDPSDKRALRDWMRRARSATLHQGHGTPSTPAEFSARQRRRLFQALNVEQEEIERPRLDVALTGATTAEHTVPVSTLGPFLTNLQESVAAVAQALTGKPTSFASIPRDIRDATTLRAATVFPSSFGLTIYGPEPESAENILFPDLYRENRTVLDDAVDTVLDIVDLSEGPSQTNDMLAEQLVPLGQRALKHIGALTSGLSEASVGLRVAWHTQGGQVRRSDWSPSGVQRVRYLCEVSEFTESETVTITGWLGAASSFNGKIEIRSDGGELIRASTDEELTPLLHEFFNKRVEAEVEVTKVQFAGGRERKIYAVTSLRNT
ncbi:hypothetical protein RKD32_003032 [Streptomyces sp. SAI-195]|uniref:hypothetical protein n=1 Tax=unclassified Streptomyces TaxID=2593676 RepID=UPI0033E1FFF5